MAFRRLSSASSTDLGENDDEAEKEERRSKASSLSISSNTSNDSIVHLSPEEMNNQIDQCLKLSAANKINDKNAFQLKMIDFLAYALKKQNTTFSNLQMASACLDVSGKIYGCRVDKVHSDLLKIVGASRGEKRPHENEAFNQDANGNIISQPRKKRKQKHTFLSSIEALRGNLETYNPLSLLDNQVDVQTTDCLYQAKIPKHANQGIALNLFNDVLLDRIPMNGCNCTNFLISKIEDYTSGYLCPSYSEFKFLGWSVDDEPSETSVSNDNDVGEYHFDMDDPIIEDDKRKSIMDYRDDQEDRFNGIAENNQQQLVDFQDMIANNPDPDANYEYSYIQDDHSIHLVRPSHWRVHIKRDVHYSGASRRKKRRKKKEIELQFAEDAKEEADSSYTTNDNKISVSASHGKIENKEEDLREDSQENMFDLSTGLNFAHGFDNSDEFEQENQLPDHSFMFPDSEPPSQQQPEAFVGENLVALPTLTENIFIPYSQRAKRVNMHQLNKSIHHALQNIDTKEFSHVYRELPLRLSKVNAKSLSPGLAFMSLLHVSHEKNLNLNSHSNYADLTIKKSDKDLQ